MNVWQLLLVFEMVLCGVVVIFLILSWSRKSRAVSKAHSPEHRLKIPNLWTDIKHAPAGSSSRVMRMKDGNYILLRLGGDTVKVLAGPHANLAEEMSELASFDVAQSDGIRRRQQAQILDDLARQIGFPKSVDELRQRSGRLHLLQPLDKG
jgi:hypothetical protein